MAFVCVHMRGTEGEKERRNVLDMASVRACVCAARPKKSAFDGYGVCVCVSEGPISLAVLMLFFTVVLQGPVGGTGIGGFPGLRVSVHNPGSISCVRQTAKACQLSCSPCICMLNLTCLPQTQICLFDEMKCSDNG